jgi:hypothetical protein
MKDEARKDALVHLIESLKMLIVMYERERSSSEAELSVLEARKQVLHVRLRLLEASAALARLKLSSLGAKDAGRDLY